MTDDAQRWKSKYLESLEQQEQLERRWDARLDLLRRGLVRSSLAAEGSDKSVDQCMQELRDILRRNDIDTGLSALIPRLEKAVLDSEKSRQSRLELNVSGVASLTDQLLALDPPREVRKALKQFARRIEERASQPRELPTLLGELSRLQQQALATIEREAGTARPGLLQRLFGGKEAAPDSSAASEPAAVDRAQPQTVDQAATPAQSRPAVAEVLLNPADEEPALTSVAAVRLNPMSELPLELQIAAATEQGAAPETPETPEPMADVGDPAYALPPIPEPGYSAVAPHISGSLLGLLDELEIGRAHV